VPGTECDRKECDSTREGGATGGRCDDHTGDIKTNPDKKLKHKPPPQQKLKPCCCVAVLPAAVSGSTSRVFFGEQSSNNNKGDVENTIQVLAELKKQQREPPFKAPQMDTPVQCTVLAEIPATNPADTHSTKKFGLHQPRPSPDSRLSLVSVTSAQLYNSYHTAPSCAPRPRRPVRPRFRGRLRRLRRHVRRRRFGWVRFFGGGGPPPPPFPRGWCSGVLLRPCCIYTPSTTKQGATQGRPLTPPRPVHHPKNPAW
jgi:hypothetical protein